MFGGFEGGKVWRDWVGMSVEMGLGVRMGMGMRCLRGLEFEMEGREELNLRLR